MATVSIPSYTLKVYPASATLVSTTDGSKFTTAFASGDMSATLSSASASSGNAIILTFSASDFTKIQKFKTNNLKISLTLNGAASVTPTARILTSKYSSGSTISKDSTTIYFSSSDDDQNLYETTNTSVSRERIENFFNYGIIIYGKFTAAISTQNPYVEVAYNSPYHFVNLSPSDGAAINKKKDILFTWELYVPTNSTNPPSSQIVSTGSQYTFHWYEKGSSEKHNVDCGNTPSVTIPGNTFTGDEIEWYVTGIMTNMVFIDNWFLPYVLIVNAPDSLSTPNVVSPNNTIISKTDETELLWEHVIDTGTEQTKADIQISANNSNYVDLVSIDGAANRYIVPADTFAAGDLFWRVRTYNEDGVAGEWSEAAHCIVIGAPAAPLLSIVDAAPRFAIRWQQSGQQGYEIMLDGQRIAKKWGETSSYQYDGYLAPGSYTVQVRIQNQYGLWSEWGSAALPITNTEGAAITLYAEADNVVRLQWSTTEAYEAYLIYRDGQLIGRTQKMTFTDHFAMGSVSYEVRGVYEAAGNYTLSNAVAVEASVDVLMISPVKDPAWQQIPLSTSSLRSRSHSATQSVTYLHYTGTALPSAEIGEALDKTYRFDAAFPQKEKAAADAFEALIGKLVCIKDPDGYRVVGVLGTHSLTSNPFYRSYSCTVTLVDWQEGEDL